MKSQFNGKEERGVKPKPLTGLQCYKMVNNVNVVLGKGPKPKQDPKPKKWPREKLVKKQTAEGGENIKIQKKGNNGKKKKKPSILWKKKSVFWELEYWKDLDVRHCIDVMHIEKNVCDSILGTLLSIKGKTKDGVNARLDMGHSGHC